MMAFVLTQRAAQTDVKDASDAPSASNFLEREKAILGDDANQFATVEDADFDDGNDDLLGGGVSSPRQQRGVREPVSRHHKPERGMRRHTIAWGVAWF